MIRFLPEWPTTAGHVRMAVALLARASVPALARGLLSDEQVRQAIIQQSITEYKAMGHPCACPYDLAGTVPCVAGEASTTDRVARRRSAIRRTSVMAWFPTGGANIISEAPPLVDLAGHLAHSEAAD